MLSFQYVDGVKTTNILVFDCGDLASVLATTFLSVFRATCDVYGQGKLGALPCHDGPVPHRNLDRIWQNPTQKVKSVHLKSYSIGAAWRRTVRVCSFYLR